MLHDVCLNNDKSKMFLLSIVVNGVHDMGQHTPALNHTSVNQLWARVIECTFKSFDFIAQTDWLWSKLLPHVRFFFNYNLRIQLVGHLYLICLAWAWVLWEISNKNRGNEIYVQSALCQSFFFLLIYCLGINRIVSCEKNIAWTNRSPETVSQRWRERERLRNVSII